MGRRGKVVRRDIGLIITFILLLSFFGGFRVSATSMPVYVKPISADGSLNYNKTYIYTFNWTTDSACNNVVFSNSSLLITTGSDGLGFVNLTIPDNLATIPSYLCEYRNGTLRAVHSLSSQFSSQIYSQNINASQNIYASGNASANYGLFNFLGASLNRITNLFVGDINSTGNINTTGIFYGSGAGLQNVNASSLGGYNADFFAPLNTSLAGNFNFNGGWQNGGLSIIGGSLYSNGTIYSVNISNLNVSSININGTFLPYSGYDNQFNLGNGSQRWNNLFIGGNLYSNGTLYENSVPLSSEYYSINNPYSYYNSTTIPSYYLSSNPYNYYNSTTIPDYALNSALSNYYLLSNPYGYYNSTNPPPAIGGNPFDQILNTTSNVTFSNISAINIMAGNICYANGTNCPSSSGITWAQVLNGTAYLSSNPYSFYNSTTLPSSSTGNPFDQSLNTSDNVSFYSVNVTTIIRAGNWGNISGDQIDNNLNWINWSQVTNGTFLLASQWNATNTSYYLEINPYNFWNSTFATFNKTYADTLYYSITNPFGYYNSTTLPVPVNIFNQILNTTSNVTFNNVTAVALNGTTVYSGNKNLTIAYLYATNGTYYLVSNPFGFYNLTSFDINNYYLKTNPLSFYNSTTLNSTVNLNLFNLTAQNVMAGNICYANGTNCPSSSGITWIQAINGTLYLSSNPFGFYNSSSGLNNLSWSSIVNSTIYLSSNPYSFYNSTTIPVYTTWAQVANGTMMPQAIYNSNYSSLYLNSNPYGFYNSTNPPPASGIQWINILNGTIYLSNNSFGFYNSTTIPSYLIWNQVVNGTLATWSQVMNGTVTNGYPSWANILNGTIYLSNNSFGFYNSTTIPNYVIWGQVVNGTLATWSNVINGTLMSQATYNSNYSSIYLNSNPFSFYNSTGDSFIILNLTTGWLNITNQTTGNLMNINGTSGFVGIGTSTPKNNLNVIGIINATNAVYSNNNMLISWANATNGTLASWSNVMNGTMAPWANILNGTIYLSNNSFGFWNSTFATFNKTYADTLYSPIGEPKAYNGSLYLSSNPYSFYNSTNPPPTSGIQWSNILNGTIYLSNNTFGFYNSTNPPPGGGIGWDNVVNGTVYLSNNSFGFYNSTNPPPAGSLTYSSNQSSANTTMSTASLYYNGTLLYLNSGTWFVSGTITFYRASGAITRYYARFNNGTNIASPASYASTMVIHPSIANDAVSLSLSDIVTLTTSGYVVLQGMSNQTSTIILANTWFNNTGNTATSINAIKLA